MTYLLLRLLKDDLKEYTYAARLAGLVYGVASGMNAILVSKLFELQGSWAAMNGLLCLWASWQCVQMVWYCAFHFDYVEFSMSCVT